MEKTSISGFITTQFPQIQKKGTGWEQKVWPRWGRVPGSQSRDWSRAVGEPASSPPLDFPANNRRGPIHSGATPRPGHRGGGQAGGRGLKGTWRGLRPTPPCLGQGVEMTREGPPAHTGNLLVAAAPFGVTSASRARAPLPTPHGTCIQSAGPLVARTTVSWTALHLVSPQKPNTIDKQEAIYIINNNNN